jgi:hypothetical protein
MNAKPGREPKAFSPLVAEVGKKTILVGTKGLGPFLRRELLDESRMS